jgi:hypothetical protein
VLGGGDGGALWEEDLGIWREKSGEVEGEERWIIGNVNGRKMWREM